MSSGYHSAWDLQDFSPPWAQGFADPRREKENQRHHVPGEEYVRAGKKKTPLRNGEYVRNMYI